MRPLFPASADLRVEQNCPAKDPFGLLTANCKPVPTDEIVTDPKAADTYNAAIEAWGWRGWLTVGRICRWAANNGADLPFGCPPPSQQ